MLTPDVWTNEFDIISDKSPKLLADGDFVVKLQLVGFEGGPETKEKYLCVKH